MKNRWTFLSDMATPKQGYFLKDGSKVPGTTTVISRFKDSGALIWWAWNQGKEGEDYRQTSKAAADAGTVAHGLVEGHLRKVDVDLTGVPGDVAEKGLSAFQSYLSWERQTGIKPQPLEIPLISETYRFGGTPDALFQMPDGSIAMGDWKSSNAVYSDYLIQLAAYKQLWEENFPDKPITGGFHICRFSKEHGDFAHHFFPKLDEAWEQFKLFLQAYEIDKRLKKRAA